MGFMRRYFFHSPIRYVVALVINVAITLIVLFLRGFNLIINYVDAFGVAGAVSVLVGLLIWVASAGAFDTMGYAFSSLSSERKYKDLYEYSVQKQEKRSRQNKTYMPNIVVGVVFLLISLLISAVGM